LPPSALDKLSNLSKKIKNFINKKLLNLFLIEKAFGSESSPVTFRILNIDLNVYTHCGVLDFTAEEDCCYLPLHV
jgi:hypothetical protein